MISIEKIYRIAFDEGNHARRGKLQLEHVIELVELCCSYTLRSRQENAPQKKAASQARRKSQGEKQ